MSPFPVDWLVRWFLRHRRDLPWRLKATPYSVWVSEVMLQQTQVSVVIPYYLRWMKAFPTIRALAKADETKVMKLWEGLGYYSRARNLHYGAKEVLKLYGGDLPSCPEKLIQIKGIGKYTLGAIQSFAFHQKSAAIDGNVLRVMARFQGIEECVDCVSVYRKIEQDILSFLPSDKPWIASEALIELGALVCKKTPDCLLCPLKRKCQAHQRGLEMVLPKKRQNPKIIKSEKQVVALESSGHFLVSKGEEGKVLQGLYHFPCFDEKPFDVFDEIEKKWGFKIISKARMEPVIHSYTRHQVTLHPWHFVVEQKKEVPFAVWHPLKRLLKVPFNAGHRKIFSRLI